MEVKTRLSCRNKLTVKSNNAGDEVKSFEELDTYLPPRKRQKRPQGQSTGADVSTSSSGQSRCRSLFMSVIRPNPAVFGI